MPTELLFRTDAYQQSCEATVLEVNDRGGVVLDRTVFYATGGGQPGDKGALVTAGGVEIPIETAVYGEDKSTVVHVPAAGAALPSPGDKVTARLDWAVRLPRMRVHTALHLLTTVLPYPVTGGSIGDGEGRLDFDIPDAGLDKDDLTARLAEKIGQNAEVRERWITDAELEANPGLVKTMSVKPPMGSGRVRLVEIVGLDLQPCGGTHVRNTSEIGAVAITNIEKKGKQNRRVRIALV
ncbi:Ala-tRNA(Pro) hydrolase [Alsobacter soli]|uniref:Alanine--tRNA ligase n=1 Tax=Alsobacter soli TaxID=2109933 RepID=A0A2T1HW29_9HYPH|nr:alanyl-tRNA editing protein [Alsobacter soli]PSC05828.1 Ala-tRNA(Pro) hydrolase [Alsobacter soli]